MIKVDDLAREVEKALSQYGDEVLKTATAGIRETAVATVDELKKTSPKDTGAYSKSWTWEGSTGRKYQYNAVVHNKKHYRLTHILENGYVKRNGERTTAQPHIEPAERNAEKRLIEAITRGLNG